MLPSLHRNGIPIVFYPFSSDKRLDDTVKLIPENAFSYSEFNDVILVSYLIGNDTVNCFILDGKDAVTAANKVKGYREFMLELGGEPVTYSTNVSDIQGVNLIGDFEAVFSIQRYVVGVHAASDKSCDRKSHYASISIYQGSSEWEMI